jgi:hypothetical protein
MPPETSTTPDSLSSVTIFIERSGRERFVLPEGHTAELTDKSVILSAPSAGGRYVLEGVKDSLGSKQRIIQVGALELGWWDGAPPGIVCEYPFPDGSS